MRNLEKTDVIRSGQFQELLSRFEACKIYADSETTLDTLAHVTANLGEESGGKIEPVNPEVIYADPDDEFSASESENGEMTDYSRLVDIKIVGIHKRRVPKRSFYFVILASWDDDSSITLYRKWKEIKAFHDALVKTLKVNSESEEAKYFLNKLHRKSSKHNVITCNGTMRRLRMLDALNQYCQAILYYDQVADASFVRRFFHPTNEDLNVSNWSSSGRTYFYVTNATLSDDSGTQNHVIEDEPISSEDSSTSDDDVMKRHSALKRISSSAMSLASTGWSSRSTLNITSPIEPEVYVAVEDHVTDVDDRRQNVMPLSVGEKVEVYTKSDTGWWFVKKEGSDVTKEFGYVPASYLVPAVDFGGKSEITQMPTAYKPTNQRRFRDLAESESSFVSEPSLVNLNSHEPIRASGSLGSAYQLTSSYSGDKNNNIKRKPSSDFISVRAHTAQGPDELSFGENAILKILKVNEDGWWLARYKDKNGLVPGVHLRRYNDPIRRLSMEVLNFA